MIFMGKNIISFPSWKPSMVPKFAIYVPKWVDKHRHLCHWKVLPWGGMGGGTQTTALRNLPINLT